ncbi:alsin-like [Mya arenaria]|uniref:alsin-like n=1 Tax=Mya arenaria TaxID=6604 RepID=UPI0022E569BD|nr:alsin-like [Mya arenaria]
MASKTEEISNREQEGGQVYVWQGYTGNVELVSYTTFLTRPVWRVALGEEHSLVLTRDHALYALGSNTHGQLGLPALSAEYSFDPCLVEKLSGVNVTEIACGNHHSACVTEDGCLYLWGENRTAQCGHDPNLHSKVVSPELVELVSPGSTCQHGVVFPGKTEKSKNVVCGFLHTLVLSQNGNLWTCGSGPQLGFGEDASSWKPKRLEEFCDKTVISIQAGDGHNIVLVQEVSETKEHDMDINLKEEVETDNVEIVCSKCAGEVDNDAHERNEGAIKKKEQSVTTAGDAVEAKADSQDEHQAQGKELVKSEDGNTKTVDDRAVTTTDEDEVKTTTTDIDGVESKPENEDVCDANDVIRKSEIKEEIEGPKVAEAAANADDDIWKKRDDISEDVVQKRRRVDVDLMTLSVSSDISVNSSGSRLSHSKSILDEAGARQFLARQFQDDDELEPAVRPTIQIARKEMEAAKAVTTTMAPASPGSFMVTNMMSSLTSQVSTMTSKAFSSFSKIGFQYGTESVETTPDSVGEPSIKNVADDTVSEKSESEPSEKVKPEMSETNRLKKVNNSTAGERDLGSTEYINLDNSGSELGNLAMSDESINMSQLSLPESEISYESSSSQDLAKRIALQQSTGSLDDLEGQKGSSGDRSLEPKSPVKKVEENARRSVSKEPQSIRTIEAKQENLKKRSLSLNAAKEEEESGKKQPIFSNKTEVWGWGRNSRGQVGVGDMLDRDRPSCIQILTGRRIVKVACGAQHTVAISSTGEVYSWGHNESGQLGHTEPLPTSPARVQLSDESVVWDIGAGSNHSLLLVDMSPTQETKAEVFYSGKHPCKDLYVPIFKTSKFTHLSILSRKVGWISHVATGGDNCACISLADIPSTSANYTLTRHLRAMHRRLHAIGQNCVKRIQISGFLTSLTVHPYKKMLTRFMRLFMELSDHVGSLSVELTELLCHGEPLTSASFFTHYEVYLEKLKAYSIVFEDMIAASGYEYATKNSGSLFEGIQEFYGEMLPAVTLEAKPDHTARFRELMHTPISLVRGLSDSVNKFADIFDKNAKEHNLVKRVHLHLEHFLRLSTSHVADADKTKLFWESAPAKLTESVCKPARRLIKESKSSPLTLTSAGRFSTNNFYLFNDIFIHSQYSSHQTYPLETVWIDAPTSDSANQQYVLTITTPEDVLTVYAPSAQGKTEWLIAFNTAINKVLASQKAVKRQDSGERVHTPVVRLASYTFTKHLLYKDAAYRGYWLNGKIHGYGGMVWKDGRKYKGKFKHGSITGSGKMTILKDNKTEEIQEGMWKEAKLHGHAKILYSSGDVYEGHFKEGLRQGHGAYRKGKGPSTFAYIYVGEWLFDHRHGYGVLDDVLHGEKYLGMWQEDQRHGDGLVVTLDGMYFEGNFQQGKLVGRGLMLTDDGSCYEGEFNGITQLHGKGILRFPGGDRIEGTFLGTWNQGLKVSGMFHKAAPPPVRHSWTSTTQKVPSSDYGHLCVKPDRKWEELFYQCFGSLGYSGEGEPNTARAWDLVVACIVAGKQAITPKGKSSLTSGQRIELSTLERLEQVPTHSLDVLTAEQFTIVQKYLNLAFGTTHHPLGQLLFSLVEMFRAAYVGIGAHPRLLMHAIQEIRSYTNRIYRVCRILFPELPTDGKATYLYPEKSNRAGTPFSDCGGFIQRQVSETEEEDYPVCVMSAAGILHTALLPRIYPALFDLYALYCDRDDERYWERTQKLNRQGDMALMAYLGIEQQFWCFNEDLFKKKDTRLSTIRDHSYAQAIEILQQISTAFCPLEKLEVIERTFLAITQAVEAEMGGSHTWCLDDLFPIFQYVVIRARIHHLGAEVAFIDDLMESHLEFGELGIMFTTLKACYFQIQNEKVPIH